ncbi:hypothetical protein JCM6294_2122 [Bacteroides pyogenes DSM 20611 = JCM 6294]|uniref:Uncharacterized protein n=1 Tax=Bacteroides pyogenes DSM 20611 = JCM 6294 TaxID=1121100 RepID=W4PHE7_9BACE|nr:hypothetical protein JCM6294_2122 [Bacteroides pyogenes DSM 20611 = JCM 6294]
MTVPSNNDLDLLIQFDDTLIETLLLFAIASYLNVGFFIIINDFFFFSVFFNLYLRGFLFLSN